MFYINSDLRKIKLQMKNPKRATFSLKDSDKSRFPFFRQDYFLR